MTAMFDVARGKARKKYVHLTQEQMQLVVAAKGIEPVRTTADRYGLSYGRTWKIQNHSRRCKQCSNLTTTPSQVCRSCIGKRNGKGTRLRPKFTPEEWAPIEARIIDLREREKLTYDQIAERVDLAVSMVRKALDPNYKGVRRQIGVDGITEIIHRDGHRGYRQTIIFGGRLHSVNGATIEDVQVKVRVLKAERDGVSTKRGRREPDLTDVYAAIRTAASALDRCNGVPLRHERAIHAALIAAEDATRAARTDMLNVRPHLIAAA